MRDDHVCPSCGDEKCVYWAREPETFSYATTQDTIVELTAMVDVGRCKSCSFTFTDHTAEVARTEAICKHLQQVVKRAHELLGCMRDEAEEAWLDVRERNDQLKRGDLRHKVGRDRALFDEVRTVVGPSTSERIPENVHIAWGDKAICHFTQRATKYWPKFQTAVDIAKLITAKNAEDPTDAEFVAYPPEDWGGVTCEACRIRLPTLLREMGVIMRDMHRGIMEGYRTHPETIAATKFYEEVVLPNARPERQREYAAAKLAAAEKRESEIAKEKDPK